MSQLNTVVDARFIRRELEGGPCHDDTYVSQRLRVLPEVRQFVPLVVNGLRRELQRQAYTSHLHALAFNEAAENLFDNSLFIEIAQLTLDAVGDVYAQLHELPYGTIDELVEVFVVRLLLTVIAKHKGNPSFSNIIPPDFVSGIKRRYEQRLSDAQNKSDRFRQMTTQQNGANVSNNYPQQYAPHQVDQYGRPIQQHGGYPQGGYPPQVDQYGRPIAPQQYGQQPQGGYQQPGGYAQPRDQYGRPIQQQPQQGYYAPQQGGYQQPGGYPPQVDQYGRPIHPQGGYPQGGYPPQPPQSQVRPLQTFGGAVSSGPSQAPQHQQQTGQQGFPAAGGGFPQAQPQQQYRQQEQQQQQYAQQQQQRQRVEAFAVAPPERTPAQPVARRTIAYPEVPINGKAPETQPASQQPVTQVKAEPAKAKEVPELPVPKTVSQVVFDPQYYIPEGKALDLTRPYDKFYAPGGIVIYSYAAWAKLVDAGEVEAIPLRTFVPYREYGFVVVWPDDRTPSDIAVEANVDMNYLEHELVDSLRLAQGQVNGPAEKVLSAITRWEETGEKRPVTSVADLPREEVDLNVLSKDDYESSTEEEAANIAYRIGREEGGNDKPFFSFTHAKVTPYEVQDIEKATALVGLGSARSALILSKELLSLLNSGTLLDNEFRNIDRHLAQYVTSILRERLLIRISVSAFTDSIEELLDILDEDYGHETVSAFSRAFSDDLGKWLLFQVDDSEELESEEDIDVEEQEQDQEEDEQETISVIHIERNLIVRANISSLAIGMTLGNDARVLSQGSHGNLRTLLAMAFAHADSISAKQVTLRSRDGVRYQVTRAAMSSSILLKRLD